MLQKIKEFINQGYMLTDQASENSLNLIIGILEKDNPRQLQPIDTRIHELLSVKRLLAEKNTAHHFEDPIYLYVFNELRKLYNETLDDFAKKHEDAFRKHNRCQLDEKNVSEELNNKLVPLSYRSMQIEDLLTYRISLVKSYKRLHDCHCSELHLDKADNVKEEHIYEEIKRTLEAHGNKDLNGLYLIHRDEHLLTAGISFKKILQLVWQSIDKDADKAKISLCENLAYIGQNYSSLRDSLVQEKVIALLLVPLEYITDPHVNILSKQEDIVTLLRKRCDYKLKVHLTKEPLSEQSKLLYHLEKHESVKEHLNFNIYIKETIEKLIKEFRPYEFVIPDLPNLIVSYVEKCTNEISLDWLREYTKKELRNQISDISDPADKKERLCKTLEVEIQSCKDRSRTLLLQFLLNAVKRIFPKDPARGTIYHEEVSELERLHNCYKNLVTIDQCRLKLFDLAKLQNNPENQFIYQDLYHQANKLLQYYTYNKFIKTEDVYQPKPGIPKNLNIKIKVKSGQLWCEYFKTFVSQTNQLKAAVDKLEGKKHVIDHQVSDLHKKSNLFFKHYQYPKAYYDIDKIDSIKEVAAIFKDYADKAHWYYFHAFRNHVDKALDIQRFIAKCDNVYRIREYLIAVRDGLMAAGKLNIEGSLSRRINYCLETLLPEPRVNSEHYKANSLP